MADHRRQMPRALGALLAVLGLMALTPTALAQSATGGTTGADSPSADSQQPAGAAEPPARARIVGGKAVPPQGAPRAVVATIQAANRIAAKPYRWGGGHRRFEDSAYDCSGAVSYALHGAGLLRSPLVSGSLMTWGRRGAGRWITVYANRAHTFLVIAGLRFDTGWRSPGIYRYGVAPGSGPRWGFTRPTRGFAARHPAGL